MLNIEWYKKLFFFFLISRKFEKNFDGWFFFFSANDNFDSTFKSNLLVYNTGEVNWIPPGLLKFSCKLDITWFPFDEQICGLKVSSTCWQYFCYLIVGKVLNYNTNLE